MSDHKINNPEVVALLNKLSSEYKVKLSDLRYSVRSAMISARFELNIAEIEDVAMWYINSQIKEERPRKVIEYRNRIIRAAEKNRTYKMKNRRFDDRSREMSD
jgi:hypothetical protein